MNKTIQSHILGRSNKKNSKDNNDNNNNNNLQRLVISDEGY